MTITDIALQVRNPDRVNVSVDGKYRFSLDVAQVAELGVKKGREIDESELALLMGESEFGKLYQSALEYSIMRPRSQREMRDYLYRKTLPRRYKSRTSGEIKERAGVAKSIAERTFNRLVDRNYVNDEVFARWWVESRNLTRGTSLRKLRAEMMAKGIAASIIDAALSEGERNDNDELLKILQKKRRRYPDDQKLMQYLARQGFRYDDIKEALENDNQLNG
jgi:regulatory protein